MNKRNKKSTKLATKHRQIRHAKHGQGKKPAPPKFKQTDDGVATVDAWDEDSWLTAMKQAVGTRDLDLANHLLSQAASVRSGRENDAAKLNVALASVHGIGPNDELEGMLAVQMVGVHNLALQFMRRAILPEQTVEVVDRNVNRAVKLMRTFTAQIEALNRYRGKGQQKVTVEHVHVNAGGQAIVGTVSHSKKAKDEKKS